MAALTTVSTTASGVPVVAATPASAPSVEQNAMTNVQHDVQAGVLLAQRWVQLHLPYSQKHYCDPHGSQIRKKSYPGAYRTDCSGLVCMAWGLPVSYTTRTLFLGTFPGAAAVLRADKKFTGNEKASGKATLVPWAELRTGDALWKVGHVMLVVEMQPEDQLGSQSHAIVYHQTPGGACQTVVKLADPNGSVEGGYQVTIAGRKGKKRVWCLRNKEWASGHHQASTDGDEDSGES